MTYYLQSSGKGHHIAISVLHDDMLCEHLNDSDQLPLVSWRRKREKRGREQSEISASSTQHAVSSPGPGGQWVLTGQTKSGVNGVTGQLQ